MYTIVHERAAICFVFTALLTATLCLHVHVYVACRYSMCRRGQRIRCAAIIWGTRSCICRDNRLLF